MTPLQKRFKRVIQFNGETLTINTTPQVGLFGIVSPGQARRYVNDGVVNSVSNRPFTTLYLSSDATISESDQVDRAGVTLSVLKVLDLRQRGEVLARLALPV